MIYLDSSALVKLALTGPESAELARWLSERDGQPLVSSALHRTEVPRAVWQADPEALPRSYKLINLCAGRQARPDRVRELRRAAARRGAGCRAPGCLARFAVTPDGTRGFVVELAP